MTQGNDQLPVGEPPSTEGPPGKTDKEQSHLEPVGEGAKALRGSRRTARRFPRAWRGWRVSREPLRGPTPPHSPVTQPLRLRTRLRTRVTALNTRVGRESIERCRPAGAPQLSPLPPHCWRLGHDLKTERSE